VKRLGAHRMWLVYRGAEALSSTAAWTIMFVYLVRDVGMSPLELVLMGTALEVAYFVFEVPTGIVADLYGRKRSIVVAELIMGASLLLIGLVPEVWAALAGSALMGFGWTFKSGAEDAWLHDELGEEGMRRAYQRGAQTGRVVALAGIGGAVGLALLDLQAPIVFGGVVLLALGAALPFLMPETGLVHSSHLRGLSPHMSAMATTGREGARLIRARPVLLLILGITFFGGMWSEAFDRLGQAHLLVDVGVPDFAGLDAVVWFGVLAAVGLALAVAVAQPLVRRFERLDRAAMARTLLVLDAAMIASTLAFAFAGAFALAVGAYWAINVARSLAGPVSSAWVNSNVDDSRVRATVISMTNLGDSVGQWGGGPALGAIGNVFGIRAALAAGAIALVPALGLYGRAIRHHGREPELDHPSPAPVSV
jgi:DHA3 family tetracycline resistance protein-like MFS transporter